MWAGRGWVTVEGYPDRILSRRPVWMHEQTTQPQTDQDNARAENSRATVTASGASDGTDALRNLRQNRPLKPHHVLAMQRTRGNRFVQRIVEGNPGPEPEPTLGPRAVRTRTLSEAMGFPEGHISQYENPDRNLSHAHPMIANIIQLTREVLVQRYLEEDAAAALDIYWRIEQIYDNLRDTIHRAGEVAPHQLMWQSEEIALIHLIGEAKSGPRHAALVGSYTVGREDHHVRALVALNRRVVEMFQMEEGIGSQATHGQGGSISRKIYLGSSPGPGFMANFYLKLTASRAASGDVQTSGGLSIDDEGRGTPTISRSRTGADGSRVTGEVSGSESGPAGRLRAETDGPGDSHVTGEMTTGGVGTVTYRAPADGDFTSQMSLTTDGNLTYQIRNNARSSIAVTGGMSSLSLTAMAPELRMGTWTVQPGFIVEIVPYPQMLGATVTQTAAMASFLTRYYATLAVVAATAVIAAGLTIPAGAAAPETGGTSLALPILVLEGGAGLAVAILAINGGGEGGATGSQG